MVELQEIFDIKYGNKFDLNKMKLNKNTVHFIGRSAKNNGVTAKVTELENTKPYKGGLIIVALGGSVLASFLQAKPFYTGQNIAVLSPKDKSLTAIQKLFYCKAIHSNAYKFSTCGREANRTLKNLQVPSLDELPSWVDDVDLSRFNGAEKPKISAEASPPEIKESTKLTNLFVIKNGIAATVLNIKENRFSGCIAYVRPASTNARVIRGYLDRSTIDERHIYSISSLFVSTNGEGSHSYSYVSIEDFVPNSDVSVLIPKSEMSLELKLYYAKCITQNRYLFSYGRKPKGKRLAGLLLPKPTENEIKQIEKFINTLNYSSNL